MIFFHAGDRVQYTPVREMVEGEIGYRQFLFHRAMIVAVKGDMATVRPEGCYSAQDDFDIHLAALRAEDDFGLIGETMERMLQHMTGTVTP